MNIWYLTRSYPPYQKGGGPLLRKGQVGFLKELNYDITIIMPNYGSSNLKKEDNIILIPQTYNIKLSLYLERLGYYEDYLDIWVENAFEYLKSKVRKEDIIFATSGGELGMIKLGSRLKDELSCNFIINFHDPLNYGYMNGLRRDKKFHIGREKAHKKYISNVDLIFTSSKYYAEVLSHKFPQLSNKIYNNYFGYIQQFEIEQVKRKISTKTNIAYVGTMGVTQSPELLYSAWKLLNDNSIEIYFIGNTQGYKPLKNVYEKGVHFIDFMPHGGFLEFMCENIDIGFVSLANDYFGACVPSKIYEYINLGLPMIGALPDGDAKEMINSNGYGVACQYDDMKCLGEAMKKLKDKNCLNKIKNKILDDRDTWSMQYTMLEVDKLLEQFKI